MSYAASIQSTTGTLAGYARKMSGGGKADLNIILDNHTDDKIYSTFDGISGRVAITASHGARFDEVQITLEGTMKTFVENMSPHTTRSRTTAVHNFLKLTMPIPESEYPQPRIAEAGQTYTFPFNFVIPEQLLLRACAHKCESEGVHAAHLQLPPSMGDHDVSVLDDFTPAMVKVSYAVKVRVVRNREVDIKEVVLAQGQKKIFVAPSAAELPALKFQPGENDYVLSKTKSLKKGVFSGKLGKITVSTVQPSALVLPAPVHGNTATTMAELRLRFDPRSESIQPPRLGGLSTKLKISTFYAVRPAHDFPSRVSLMNNYESIRAVYETSVNLSSRCVEAVSWNKHRYAPAYTRRDSNSTCSSSDCPSDCEAEPKEGKEYYEATILVPITLPASRAWVPTFHSCVASRVYMIDLNLSVHTPGAGVPASSITLHVPVQVAQTGTHATRPTLTAAEAAAELAQLDEYFRPRVIEAPSEELVGNSVLTTRLSPIMELPPSYEHDERVRARVVDPGRS